MYSIAVIVAPLTPSVKAQCPAMCELFMSTLTPQAFVAKWRGDARKERSVSQEHFLDICRMLGRQFLGTVEALPSLLALA